MSNNDNNVSSNINNIINDISKSQEFKNIVDNISDNMFKLNSINDHNQNVHKPDLDIENSLETNLGMFLLDKDGNNLCDCINNLNNTLKEFIKYKKDKNK